MTKIEREAQQAKAKEPTQGFYQSKLSKNPALFESYLYKPSAKNTGFVTRMEVQQKYKTSLIPEGTDEHKEAQERCRTLEAKRLQSLNLKVTAHQKLYIKSPILSDIPGFPEIEQNFQRTARPRNLRSLCTKQTPVSKVKNQWSAMKSSRIEGGNDTFLYSIMNSTKAGEEEHTNQIYQSANSSMFGTRD